MANVTDLAFEGQSVEGFFNELKDAVKALITTDGVYKLTKTKDDPALFTDAVQVDAVPDGLNLEDGRIYFSQDEADYLYVKFVSEEVVEEAPEETIEEA